MVTILSISLFVLGLGTGPLLVGPLSEVYGRNIVYRLSYFFFFVFMFPVAFAPNIGQIHLAMILFVLNFNEYSFVPYLSICYGVLWRGVPQCSWRKCERSILER